MCGRHLIPLGSACDTSPHQKMPSYCIIRCVAASSSCWSDVCRRWWAFLFSSVFSLSSLKNYSLAIFVVVISTLVLIHLISNFFSCPFRRNFTCFQFHHSILILYILFFLIWSSFFWLFFGPFVELIFLFNFTLQSTICLYFYFYLSSFFRLFF